MRDDLSRISDYSKDYRKEGDPIVTIAYEFGKGSAVHKEGDVVTVLDIEGNVLGNVEVVSARITKATDRTVLLKKCAHRGNTLKKLPAY